MRLLADGGETVPLGEERGSSAAGACKALSFPNRPFNMQPSHCDAYIFTEETTGNMAQRFPSRDLRFLTQLGSSPGEWHCLLGAHIVVLARAAQQSLEGPSGKLCILPLPGF